MQRPLHARVRRPNPNPPPPDDHAYVPTYGSVPAGTWTAEYPTYPAYYPMHHAPDSSSPREDIFPTTATLREKEQVVLPQPTQVKSRKQSTSNAEPREKHKSRPVYDGPVTYGTPPVSAPPRHKRRNSEPARHRAEGNSRPTPKYPDSSTSDHAFVSLSSSHTLKILHLHRNISDNAFREGFLQAWPEGIENELRAGSSWIIRFKGHPWSANGEPGFYGRRLMCRVFELLGNGGYSYVSTTNSSDCSHRATHIFALTPTFFTSQYFTMSFSRRRQELYTIDAPGHIVTTTVATVRKMFSKSTEARLVADGVYGIKLSAGGAPIRSEDIPPRLAPMLQAVSAQGFRLEATIQMAREGFFGFLGRTDVWIFRSNVPLQM
ncbi:uncharacterized protein EI90DRAFT_3017810 [Cantharellus anzutake]|uniref:uncharacterized protein n=1 Tax=Cantharellus anzutake TaxID=1750568 RepID=UPI00190369AF|nr:uncharacterized protein EI90DRAFT_3017810 [Cantharellus anzutake]KAF8328151.1 hypothetical protein EI90DRAFT_3017810 [Cantharellus anzutake]